MSSLGILGGNGAGRKIARPLGHYSLAGLGLGAMEFCPSPCTANPDPEVKRYQSMMNTDLKRLKYNQVLVDGRIGKATCGLNMFFSQVPQLFDTARASWDDNLAFRVHTACDGKPFALPSPVKKADNVFVEDKDDPTCKKESPAWGTTTDKIRGYGNQLNMQLDELGYEPIAATGELNPTFCGAAKLVDALNNTTYLCNPGFNCKSFVSPKKKSTPVPVAAPVLVATPANTNLPTTPPTTKAASMATTGIVFGVLGVGGYFLGKKYGWF